MSSACVCHLDQWCFYCEMYSPLEKEHVSMKRNVEHLQKERDEYKSFVENINEILKDLKTRYFDSKMMKSVPPGTLSYEGYGRYAELKRTIEQLEEAVKNHGHSFRS